MRPRPQTALLASLLALLLLAPGTAGAVERTVSVTGNATQAVPNDTAAMRFSVSKERSSRAAALQIASARLRAVIAAVQKIPGIESGDVTTGQISIRKVTRDERAVYRASEGIGVILHQPDHAGEATSAAVAAGATGTGGPRFFPGDPEAAYNSTLLIAFDRAQARASALAARAGAKLGPAISIDEGSEIVPNEPSLAKGAEGVAAPTPPTKPGSSTVAATVHVVFALE
jgi:uncharacterized protein YggE